MYVASASVSSAAGYDVKNSLCHLFLSLQTLRSFFLGGGGGCFRTHHFIVSTVLCWFCITLSGSCSADWEEDPGGFVFCAFPESPHWLCSAWLHGSGLFIMLSTISPRCPSGFLLASSATPAQHRATGEVVCRLQEVWPPYVSSTSNCQNSFVCFVCPCPGCHELESGSILSIAFLGPRPLMAHLTQLTRSVSSFLLPIPSSPSVPSPSFLSSFPPSQV